MERSKAGTKKSPNGLSLPNQNTKIIIILSNILKEMEKHNEIQLTI